MRPNKGKRTPRWLGDTGFAGPAFPQTCSLEWQKTKKVIPPPSPKTSVLRKTLPLKGICLGASKHTGTRVRLSGLSLPSLTLLDCLPNKFCPRSAEGTPLNIPTEAERNKTHTGKCCYLLLLLESGSRPQLPPRDLKSLFFHREPGLSGALILRCDLGQVAPPFPEGVHCASNLPTVPQSEMAPGAADGQGFFCLCSWIHPLMSVSRPMAM